VKGRYNTMTIRDMQEQGIEIQGKIIVKKYDEQKSKYNILDETESSTFNREITYIYAEGNSLIIEVE
jgi:hypothetical protein